MRLCANLLKLKVETTQLRGKKVVYIAGRVAEVGKKSWPYALDKINPWFL
jgi:hypothetical protein